MSALNVTQSEADVLVDSLKMFAEVHKNAGGSVPAEVADLLVKLAPAPVAVVEEETPAPKARKSKATSEEE